jgi:hypothetical protein
VKAVGHIARHILCAHMFTIPRVEQDEKTVGPKPDPIRANVGRRS